MKKPQFDIILFGATSFVGRLVARHVQTLIDQRSSALPGGFSWAIAARDQKRLLDLKKSLGPTARDLPVIAADAHDEMQLRHLCAQGRVVISTVGPYALHGETLIRVCAETGTDYCDLTGETQWIKRMIVRYQETAEQSGARLVNCCGFDAIPSDLGVYFLQQHAQARFGGVCKQIKMGVKALQGGFSGGTIASMINLAKEAMADSTVRKQLGNPYWLCPDNHGFTARQPANGTRLDKDFNSWTAPFVMAGINTRIVHRSNALLNNFYGADFLYSEETLTGKHGRWRSYMLRSMMSLFYFLVALPPSRWVLQQWFLPKPGEGPSETQQRNGFFQLRFIGLESGRAAIHVEVEGDSDPGYSGTAKMLSQAALCLAFDIQTGACGGFYTPASLLGEQLIQRLSTYAGIQFRVIENQADS